MIKAWALLCLVAVVGAVGCDDTGAEGNGSPAGPSGLALSGCISAPADLVAWLPGDGHSNDIAGHNHGSLQNGAAFATGQVGQAFDLDGIDDYVLIPDGPDLNPATQITLDAWIYLEDFQSGALSNNIFVKDDNDSGQRDYLLHAYGDEVQCVLFKSGGGLGVAQGGALSLNTWHHVACTYDGATVTVYVDGSAVGGGALSGAINNTSTPLRIGGTNEAQWERFFNGRIDEVEVFSRALSAGEIAAIYNAGTAGKCKPQCRGRAVTTTGTVNGSQIDLTEGNDVWVGSSAAETVYGYGGDDRMCGKGGADELHGGDDQDQLQGDGGRDRLFGENDNDKLFGNAGNDHLDGGAGNDNCSGGPGTNTKVDCED